MDYATAITTGAGLLMLGLLMVALAHLVSVGDLPRNGAIGVRTRATKASEGAWRAGHLAALPLLRATGWAGLAMCVVPTLSVLVAEHLLPAAAFTVGAVAGGVGYLVVVGLVVWAAVVADRAARTVGNGPSMT